MRLWVLPRNAPEGWTPFVWLIYLGFYLSYAAALEPKRIRLDHRCGRPDHVPDSLLSNVLGLGASRFSSICRESCCSACSSARTTRVLPASSFTRPPSATGSARRESPSSGSPLVVTIVAPRGVDDRPARPRMDSCHRILADRGGRERPLRRALAQGPQAGARAGRDRAHGEDCRARAHWARPARPARSHAVGDRAEVGARVQDRRPRSRPGAAARFATSSASPATR